MSLNTTALDALTGEINTLAAPVAEATSPSTVATGATQAAPGDTGATVFTGATGA